MPTRAELKLDVLRYSAQKYRDLYVQSFEYAMDGEAALLSNQVRKQLSATNINYWMQLKAQDQAGQPQEEQGVGPLQAEPAGRTFDGARVRQPPEAKRALDVYFAAGFGSMGAPGEVGGSHVNPLCDLRHAGRTTLRSARSARAMVLPSTRDTPTTTSVAQPARYRKPIP